MVTCGICHDEHLTGIGELDSCDHSFCFACIQHWAEIESRCPFCKSRFTTISRKVLDLDKLPDSGAEFHDTVRQRFPGSVLETVAIPERNQVYLGDAEWDGEGEGQDPLGNVVCMECGRGDDEDNLMLCDGCERACHTYCANLDALPEGDWFCWVCQENRDRELAGEEVVDLTAARRPQRSTRTTLVASDFTLPRSRRRASSPGARSEISRPRRVRRRLVRSGEGLQPRRSGGSQRHGSDADSILNALERSISARDNAGMSTSTEHRRLAGLRGAWNSVRQGHRPFPVAAHPPPPHMPSTAPQADGPESEAWAAFEASRRAQDRAARRASATTAMPASNIQPVVPGSPPAHRHSGQQSASSLARQAVAEARSRGRRLGPTGRQLAASNPRTPLPVHRLSSSAQNSRVGASPRSSPVGPTVALERRRASADHDPPRSPRLRHASPMCSPLSKLYSSQLILLQFDLSTAISSRFGPYDAPTQQHRSRNPHFWYSGGKPSLLLAMDSQLEAVRQEVSEVKGKIANTEQKLAAAEHAPNGDKDLLLSLNNQLLSLNNQVLSLNEKENILLRNQAPRQNDAWRDEFKAEMKALVNRPAMISTTTLQELGTTSHVYEAFEDGEQVVAKVPFNRDLSQECSILRSLQGTIGVPSILREHCFRGSILMAPVLAPLTAADFFTHNLQNSLHPLVQMLQAAHYKPVINRDVRPSNLMYIKSTIYLVDWGSATLQQSAK
ncbi:hypothetical protein WJX79_003775 [Trebouxia sp. C0005]